MSKTVQKSGAQPAVRQDSHAVYPTHYSVKIHSLRPEGSCRATASVNINGCFAVRGIKVMDSSKGLFVSMPHKPSVIPSTKPEAAVNLMSPPPMEPGLCIAAANRGKAASGPINWAG